MDYAKLMDLAEATDPEQIRRLKEELGLFGSPDTYKQILGEESAAALENAGYAAWFTPSEFSRKPPPLWVVPNYIPSGMVTWFGVQNALKTFVALDAALSVATGTHWLGKPVPQRNVAYFLAEGEGGFASRIAAWLEARDLSYRDLDGRFWVVPSKLRLQTSLDIDIIRGHLDTFDLGLVVLDTWGRTIIPGDENDNKIVNEVLEELTALQAASGASFWFIHHVGKQGAQAPRGASALSGAVDCEIKVEPQPAERPKEAKLTCTKQKEAERFKPVLLDVEAHGTSITFAQGCRPADFEAADTRMLEQTALTRAARNFPLSTQAAKELLDVSEQTARRRLQELVKEGVFEVVGIGPQTRYQLASKGGAHEAP